MKWYEVVSPSIRHDYGGYEPPEFECCYVAVEAKNKREAKMLAIQHPDMSKWVSIARGDNQNPFSKLEVTEALCWHEVCCITDDCFQCKAEWELHLNVASDESADVLSD